MNQHRDIVSLPTHVPSASVGRNVIAVIGIDRYRHWRALGNAVSDANGTRSLFLRLGFEEVTAPLLDERATGQAIRTLVTDDLSMLGDNDRLVLFYAGHGGTRVRSLGGKSIKTGYLIPVDAANEPNKVATWIELEDWLRSVSTLPPKHILVILDACYSGIALSPIIKWGRDGGGAGQLHYASLQDRRSRLIITSALDDEIALDTGPVHGHSLFTGCLIQALTGGLEGEAGDDRRPWVTGSDIGRYLRRRVLAFPDHERRGRPQTPDFGSFDFDDRGEMLIPVLVDDRTVVPVVEVPVTVVAAISSSPAVAPSAAARPPAAPAALPPVGLTAERLSMNALQTSVEPSRSEPAVPRYENLMSRWRRRAASVLARVAEPAAPSPSVPHVIFGVSTARLGEPAFQRRIVWITALVLLALGFGSLVTMPAFVSSATDIFAYCQWPFESGIAYILIGLVLTSTRPLMSHANLQWCIFILAGASIFVYIPLGELYVLGYPILVFGLLMRMWRPDDLIPRIAIVGAALCLIPSLRGSLGLVGGDVGDAAWLSGLDPLRVGDATAFFVHNLLLLLVLTLAMCCVAFAAPTRRIPAIVAAGPTITIVLILWMPIEKTLFLLSLGSHMHVGVALALVYGFLPVAASIGIFVMTLPAVYSTLQKRGDGRTRE